MQHIFARFLLCLLSLTSLSFDDVFFIRIVHDMELHTSMIGLCTMYQLEKNIKMAVNKVAYIITYKYVQDIITRQILCL